MKGNALECPSCHHRNPEKAKFCLECGIKLDFRCPACDALLPGQAKNCLECGQDLSQPKKLTESKPSSPLTKSPGGERRQATILFSDLSGYTAMNERLDPEEVEWIMSRVKAEAVKIVESHGGIVNQFVGDEVVGAVRHSHRP